MQTIAERTVAELVTEDYRTADVFKKYGIDFCCGGKVTVSDICRKKNISYNELAEQLYNIGNAVPDNNTNFNEWQLDKLAQYIVEKHHSYVANNIAVVRQYAHKVAQVHGGHRPEVVAIARLFDEVAEELTHHLQKEELILFPYVAQLAAAARNKVTIAAPHFGTVDNPIRMMEAEHEDAGNHFHEIGVLSDNYNPPAEACNTYRVLYAKLKEFEDDLHTHIHLENNILFPKAKQLEQQVCAKAHL
ncbi:regulator of cell morphogenesis and NO signaling [Lacibacter cauensis]|uniref:Regulator of cell morphogenesis and NO signaling n=1 Tax=Lacibacter cauensis TaxID=510947 RepID=A0A562SQP4_9BACT|nr:iron-sulfur cluster repair di-iron protein [Lacibacter cauensis]TWI83090.1 regulator of cell morphogenesis and NO signaling [Lacibacter cauensis]